MLLLHSLSFPSRGMGITPCCQKRGLNKGKWTAEEDEKLISYIKSNGDGSWRSLPKNAGLLRCGKSCRLRWINYLREDVKRGNFTAEEEETIVQLHKTFGNKWSLIASHLPAGRTDNEIKNHWNSHLSRKLYRFRSIREFTMTKEDMMKIMSTSTRRVGREVSKKCNKNATNLQNTASRTRNPEICSTSAVPKLQTRTHYLTGVNAGSDEMEREKDFVESEFFCREGWPNVFILSPNRDEDIVMNLKHFVEGGDTDKSEDIMINEGEDKEYGTIIQKESDGWSLISENGNLHPCSSPIVPYYNEEQLYWDVNCDGKEFNLWNEEEEELMIWT